MPKSSLWTQTYFLLKNNIKYILPITFISIICDQLIMEVLMQTVIQPKVNFAVLGVFAVLSFISNTFFPGILILFVIAGILNVKNPLLYVRNTLNSVMIESIRAYGSSLMWGLLFIIPGFHKFFQYLGVPFIVCLDPGYSKGSVDVLKASCQHTNRQWKKIFNFSLVFYLLIPLFFYSFFSDGQILWKTPFTSIIYILLQTYFMTAAGIKLFQIYADSIKGEPKC